MNYLYKQNLLSNILKSYGSVAVAFSGGVDSSFLLAFAKKILKDKIIAVTSADAIHSQKEIEFAASFAKKLNIKHIFINCGQMESSEFKANTQKRCYICKKLIFKKIKNIALSYNIKKIIHGENIDDLKKIRPGFKAAKELNIASPFIDAGINKKKIRELSKEMELITWNKPSISCLATSIPYNSAITYKKLKTVESAENILKNLGISAYKVIHYGSAAQVLTDENDRDKILKKLDKIILKRFKELGFNKVDFKNSY
ncbi:MAG: ATP-dependent sacrificial sulfur transferase LarE [Deltaproteobacteria bacterium]|nr:ATP-dependent sacrificial sulfur transferase LarE [Deltaproteobacteria bacterium]